MKKLIISLSLLMPVLLHAQIYIGPKLGLNYSKQNRGNDFEVFKPGIQFGGLINVPLTDEFFVQGEFLVSRKGYREEFGKDELFDELTATYLEVPILAQVKKETYLFRYFINFGIFGAYWSDGETGSRIEEGGEIVSADYDFTNSRDADGFQDNRTDFGLVLGAGIVYTINVSDIMLDIRFNRGLIDPVDVDPEPEGFVGRHNSTFTVSLAYLFIL